MFATHTSHVHPACAAKSSISISDSFGPEPSTAPVTPLIIDMATLQAAPIARQPADHAEAPLLGDQEANVADRHEADNGAGSFPWLTFLGFLFLTFNSGMAIVRSKGDRMAVAFVAFSYADLVALFVCLRMYERAHAGSAKREWLKIAVWILTTLLTFAFSSKVAAVMPPMVAFLVWLIAFATVAGGFIAFFIYKEKK